MCCARSHESLPSRGSSLRAPLFVLLIGPRACALALASPRARIKISPEQVRPRELFVHRYFSSSHRPRAVHFSRKIFHRIIVPGGFYQQRIYLGAATGTPAGGGADGGHRFRASFVWIILSVSRSPVRPRGDRRSTIERTSSLGQHKLNDAGGSGLPAPRHAATASSGHACPFTSVFSPDAPRDRSHRNHIVLWDQIYLGPGQT